MPPDARIDSRDGPVIITTRDVYNKVLVVEEIVTRTSWQGDIIRDHEGRIRGLERWRYAMPPTLVISVLALIITLLEGNRG
jgi:hypothetical protein